MKEQFSCCENNTTSEIIYCVSQFPNYLKNNQICLTQLRFALLRERRGEILPYNLAPVSDDMIHQQVESVAQQIK